MIRASVRRVPLAGQSQTVCVPEGASLAQLVAAAFPDAFLRRFVVVFVDGAEVAADAWDAFVPTGGHIVNLCVRPGDGDSGIGKVLRTVLQIAVIAAAQWVNTMLGGIPGALASAAVAIVGNMLINTLIPIKPLTARGEAPAAQYTVTGARNAVRQYAPVPLILGKHRIFPPLYGNYVQETVGNDIYLRVPFCLGPAPLAISDLKIGDTPISSFTGVEIEQRLTADAPPHTLYTGDPDQDVVGAQLTTSDTTRNTATGVDEIEVVLGFRTGLGGYDSKQRKTSKTVNIVVEYRPAGSTDAWTAYRPTAVEANAATTASGAPYRPNYFGIESDLLEYNTNLAAAGVTSAPAAITRSDPGRAFQYPIRFAVPRHPSGYEVRVRRTTAESTDPNQVDAVWWEILGSLKSDVDPFPEAGIASLVLRIKASAQLNNVIDTFNCVAEPMIPRFSSAAKASPSGATAASLTTVGVSRNPAEIALNLYRGAQTSRPRPDTHIDWPAWAAFAKFCEDNGLHYDEVVENPIGRGELARRVCSGAYGRPVKWAGKLSVVIDRDRGSEAPAQVFTPRNVANLRWTKTFPQDTHAVRIAFNNAANGWQADEVTLYLDGYDASNATLIEQLPVPGKTDPDEVRIVGRQYVNNSLRQTETFTFDMDAESLTCRLGAYAVLLHDAIDVGLGSARVVSRETSGANVTAVTLDFDIATDPLDTLAARWRKEDGTGGFAVSTEAAITRDAANAKRFVFASPVPSASAPAVGEMMLVGRTTEVALPVLVRDIAPDFGHRAQVVVIPYAPERFTPDGTPLPPHDPMVSLPIAARPATPVQLSVAANAREIVLAFTQPVSPRGVVVTGYETAVREYGNAADSWQDRGPLPSDARVFVAPPGNPGYSYDLRVIAVGRDADGYTVKSDPLIASNVAAATVPASPTGCSAAFATRTSAGGAAQLVLSAVWNPVDDPDVLDTRIEMRVSTGPDVWAELGQARAALGTAEIPGVQVGRSYTLGFVHLSRRGIASARVVLGAITAPDVLSAASSAPWAGVTGRPDNLAALAGSEAILNALVPVGSNGLVDTEYRFQSTYWSKDSPSGSTTFGTSTSTAGLRKAVLTGSGLTVNGSDYIRHHSNAQRGYFPCKAGDVIGARVLAGGDNLSQLQLIIAFRNAAGSAVGFSTATFVSSGILTGTGEETDFNELTNYATAPAGTVTANIDVRGIASTSAPVLRIAKQMLARLASGQTVVPAFAPGREHQIGADVTGSNISAGFTGQQWGATATQAQASNALVAMGPNGLIDTGFRLASLYWATTGFLVTPTAGYATDDGLRKATLTVTGSTPNNSSGQLQGSSSNALPCDAGERIEASVYLGATAWPAAQLYVYWYDASGTLLSQGYIGQATLSGYDGTGGLSTFTRLGGFATAPASTKSCRLHVRFVNLSGSSVSDAVGIATLPFLRKADATQTALSPWSPGFEAQLAADITLSNISAGFTGQAALATLNFVTIGTNLRLADGVTVATTAMVVTASGVSSGIAGQGGLATANFVLFSSTVRLADGTTLVTDAMVVTSAGVSSGIAGQGPFATGAYYEQNTDPGAVSNGCIWFKPSTAELFIRRSGSWGLVAKIAVLSATASPSSVNEVHAGSSFSSGTITITPAGGTSYSYAVQFVKSGGAGNVTLSATNAASFTATASLSSGQDVAGGIIVQVFDTSGASCAIRIPLNFSRTD